MVTAPFIISFMLPVPLASLPAVDICSLTWAAGMSFSRHGDAVVLHEEHLQLALAGRVGVHVAEREQMSSMMRLAVR